MLVPLVSGLCQMRQLVTKGLSRGWGDPAASESSGRLVEGLFLCWELMGVDGG